MDTQYNMKFYTSVSRYGNNLLYRGYENGLKVQKKVKYQQVPILFTKEKSNNSPVILCPG